jgi:hypothetical protein
MMHAPVGVDELHPDLPGLARLILIFGLIK